MSSTSSSPAASSTPSASPGTDLVGHLLTQALAGAFDSLKGKFTSNVQENGEQYLHQAVERIKETTTGVVAWAKENPVKTALALAALAAVTTFLVKTMTGPIEATGNAETDTEADTEATSGPTAKHKTKAKPRTMHK